MAILQKSIIKYKNSFRTKMPNKQLIYKKLGLILNWMIKSLIENINYENN